MSDPLYTVPWRGFRVRVTKTPRRGEWSFGLARSVWPRPSPAGMTLYVVHILWWNILLERSRSNV